jgi:hypothetical protein
MLSRKGLAVSVMLAWCLIGAAKDKKKGLLPADVLQAQTVLVLVDPNAGVAIEHPNADRTAREDVEKALMKWGRFHLVMDAADADLVITVHKGSDKIAQPTIGGVPTNNRPVVMQPTDSGGRIGARQGNPGYPGDPSSSPPPNPQPQVEMGGEQDSFVVYRGNKANLQDSPLNSPSVWRYTAKDALDSPDVPAVEVFRKVVADSEKQLAGKP